MLPTQSPEPTSGPCKVRGSFAAGIDCPGHKAGQGRENKAQSESLEFLSHAKCWVAAPGILLIWETLADLEGATRNVL